MTYFDWTAIGSMATAGAVLIAAWQLRRATSQARTNLEDDFSREYRTVVRSIPVKALLGDELEEEEFEEAFVGLYQYIDLTNEQVFLRMHGRISKTTWINWCDGIKTNLNRPAFAKAWGRIKVRSNESFTELRELESTGFSADPKQ